MIRRTGQRVARLLTGWFAAAAALCVCAGGPAAADLVRWDGGAGTLNWGDGGNWANDRVPSADDDVFFPATTPGSGPLQLGGLSGLCDR